MRPIREKASGQDAHEFVWKIKKYTNDKFWLYLAKNVL